MLGINGKVIALTGASSGIGEETAVHLAARGARVVLGARRKERLDAVVERITSQGARRSVSSWTSPDARTSPG